MAVTISGTGGITFPNSSVQTMAGVSNGTLSGNLYGTTRALATTYTNSSNKPMVIYVNTSNSPTNGSLSIFINSVNVMNIDQYGSQGGMCFIVPSGATYQITASGASMTGWYEFI